MVAISDLHGTWSWELSFIPKASLLIFTSLGQNHLLRHDLLGLWFSTWAQVHPHKNILFGTTESVNNLTNHQLGKKKEQLNMVWYSKTSKITRKIGTRGLIAQSQAGWLFSIFWVSWTNLKFLSDQIICVQILNYYIYIRFY